ncbi:MAG: hypothetical protein N3B21_15885 [Clostridia bacterium]|nr:hypothetical protein [Clostridia bacterium]
MKTTVILGAGFSKNSGVPIQSEIPKLLVSGNEKNELEYASSLIIRRFLKDVYRHSDTAIFPDLDDIFTCIDIATNSGHHLGINYSPRHLRAIRRLLVYRVFSMLENYFTPFREVRELLNHFVKESQDTSFIALNWDTVLEKYLLDINPDTAINYCNSGRLWNMRKPSAPGKITKIMKIHGSSNWLYCDNCRALFYDLYNDIPFHEKAGFQSTDTELFDELKAISNKEDLMGSCRCSICNNGISSHIATFRYRKSFRANSFPNVWKEAEDELTNSDKWVFIGYSLPEADYEFKHLLKLAELKLQHVKPENLSIHVILLNAQEAILQYKKFFGDRLTYACNGGIKQYLDFIK